MVQDERTLNVLNDTKEKWPLLFSPLQSKLHTMDLNELLWWYEVNKFYLRKFHFEGDTGRQEEEGEKSLFSRRIS